MSQGATPSLPLASGEELDLGHALVMGILNATPDSFSDGGEIDDPEDRAERIEAMLTAGVDVIDIGGESTRPGHTPVAAEEEIRRVVPVIRDVRSRDPHIPISIDTRKAIVAKEALSAGASFVNDVSGLTDPEMGPAIASTGCAYVAMRSRTCDRPVVGGCRRQILALVERATAAGVGEEAIIVDPGLGFAMRPGSSVEDNLALIDGIGEYSAGKPVLIGASRKRFVRALVGESRAAVIAGSVALAIRAVRAGASVVRVHDVEETIAGLSASGLRPRQTESPRSA